MGIVMLMFVEVQGANGSFRQDGDVSKKGDLPALINAALDQYRTENPDWWRQEHGGYTVRWGAVYA